MTVVCETRLKPRQTLAARKDEIRRMIARLSEGLVSGRIKAVIGPTGAIAFDGLTETERDGVTDACAFRQLMIMGSPLARAAIARAEQLAGRSVDRQAIATGWHSHDGGTSWSSHGRKG
jgi:hypothetical protein